jgi:hypothetical protein
MTTNHRDSEPSYSANDVEAFLSGGTPRDPSLRDLKTAIEGLKSAGYSAPSVESRDAIVAALAQAARDNATSGSPARGASALPGFSRTKIHVRAAAAVIGMAALGLSTAGAAAASESTVPGDPLYGLNRALENVGIGDGGLDERLEEAKILAERGDEEDAIEHAAESLEEEGDQASADELRKAAEAVLSEGSEQSLEVRTAVAEMLQFMADTDLEGRDFGQAVAERARAIGNGHGNRADRDAAEDDTTEDGAVDDKPGNRPEHAGPKDADTEKPGEDNSKDKPAKDKALNGDDSESDASRAAAGTTPETPAGSLADATIGGKPAGVGHR